jgi:hypothetical protein
MADETNPIAQEPPLRIDVSQDHHLDYWARKWGVTREEVRAAVLVVGAKVQDVQRYLGK